MKNISNSSPDEINLIDLFYEIYKRKIFFLSIIIFCSLSGLFIGYFSPQEIKTEAIIKIPNSKVVGYFEDAKLLNILNSRNIFEKNNVSYNTLDLFHYEFKLNLLSLNNQKNFLKESIAKNYIMDFSKSVDIQNAKIFNNNKILISEENNNTYKIIFRHPENLNGSTLLNDYIKFTIKKTSTDVTKIIANSLETQFAMLDIKKNFYKGIHQSILTLPTNQKIDIQDQIKILEHQYQIETDMKYIEKKLLLLKMPLNFDVLKTEAITENNEKKTFLVIYFLIGLLIGFFYSLIHVSIKNLKK